MNVSNVAVSTNWFDLPAVDMADARSFYEGLFHWDFLRLKDEAVSDYWVIQAGDRTIGGLRKVASLATADNTPVIYFGVPNLEAYSFRVKELGGKLVGEKVVLGEDRGSYQWFRDREGNLAALWAPETEVV